MLLIATILIAAVLCLTTGPNYVLILALGTACLILLLIWSPKPKRKAFSENDIWEGVFLVKKPFAKFKLWTPPIPGVKRRKQKGKQD